ncbi:hypothetical protein SAMN05518849_11871 [Sphingobium sp. AP50]|nr:hypothetical protein SAMN05518849_11871 [Sphingobium sp. AP50]
MTSSLISLTLLGFLAQENAARQSSATSIRTAPVQEVVHDGVGFAIRVRDSAEALEHDDDKRTVKLGARVVLPRFLRSARKGQEASHGVR